MEFQRGGRAMIHPDIAFFNKYEGPSINETMCTMGGQVGTISSANWCVHFQDLDFAWLPKWLIPIEDEQDEIQNLNMDEIL